MLRDLQVWQRSSQGRGSGRPLLAGGSVRFTPCALAEGILTVGGIW